ncbi:MAG: VWA domain-containing protein [Acidobacteriaceae bacterium]|nr:VWA domain-containing protein [Acidobacteriaceae bacterium]MBV9441249.1 VWA domain-containing protein [Acidobacteriaceae bacterium]
MKSVAVALTAFVALGALPFAFQAQDRSESDAPTIRAEVTRVNMLFTVTDKKGRFVTDLGKDEFKVFENKKPQKILEFTSESDLPLRLAILVDTSNSIRDRFRFQQEAATTFINDVMRSQDKAVIVSFDTSAELAADLTSDTQVLEKAVHNLRPGGGTALYDAIFFACKDKLMLDQPMYKFRRAMVILSDGEDNESRYSRDQALEMAQRADTVIYTISTNISHVETEGDKVMRYMAEQTGGVSFFPFEAKDLNQSFENVANELRHQYNLFYRPEPLNNDGQYHTVQIKIPGRKDLVVRARRGYYARRANA